MWTEPTMSIGQSVIVSAMGLSVVFLALIVLALAVMIISAIIRQVTGSGKAAEKSAPAASADTGESDRELLAVLMSVIGEDLGLPPEQFRIKSVTEIR